MPPAPETPLELTPEQAQQARQLSLALLGVSGLAVLQGLLWIGVALTFWFGKGEFWAGVLPLLVGGASAFTGLIALTTSTDVKFLADVPAHNRNHLGNAVGGINDYLGVYLGVGTLLAVVLACKLLF